MEHIFTLGKPRFSTVSLHVEGSRYFASCELRVASASCECELRVASSSCELRAAS